MTDRVSQSADLVLAEPTSVLADIAVDDELVWALVNATPDGTLLCRPDGQILFANRQAEALFGYERAALLGQSVDMLLPEHCRRAHEAHRRRYAAKPTVRTMGARLRLYALRRDGSEFPVEVALSPVHLGLSDFVVASVRDITERLEAEAQSRHLLQLLDGTTDAVFVLARDTLRFEYANEGAIRQTGYSRDELLAMAAQDLVEADEIDDIRAMLAPLLAGEVDVMRSERVIRRRDGTALPVESQISYPAQDDGRRRLVAIARDISERRDAEAQRQRDRDQLAAVLAAANVRVRRMKPDGTITLAEGGASSRFGSHVQLLGANVFSLAADQPELLRTLERALTGERFETIVATGDRFVRDVYEPVLVDGAVGEIGLVTVDVTDLVIAERDGAQVRAAVNEANEAMALVDTASAEPIIRFANDRFGDYVGIDVREITGVGVAHFRTLVPPDVVASLQVAVAELGPGDQLSRHLVLHRPDQSELPVDIDYQRLATSADLVLIRMRDATTRLQAEAATLESETELRIAGERERMARDLHDTVIQELFAAGMTLEGTLARVADPAVTQRISAVVDKIDDAIRQLRSSIFASRSSLALQTSLGDALRDIAAEAGRVLRQPPRLAIDPAVDDERWRNAGPDLLATLRECLSNAARHAQATEVTVSVRVADDRLTLEVTDDGIGPAGQGASGGSGLRNLAERADAHGGSFSLLAAEPSGARATWTITA